MRINHVISAGIGTVVMALCAGTSEAQTTVGAYATTGRVFVDGAAIADYDQTDFEPAGPALAGGAAIGIRVWRRYSLQFEFDVPGEHVDLSHGPHLEHRFVSKTTAHAFLFGRQFRMETRVPIVALIGVSALTHRTHVTGFIDLAPPDVNGSRHVDFDDHDVEQWVALSMGVEVPIALTRHVRLVPQLRTHQVANAELGQLFPAGKSALRPRLALRWQF
jgi:hypothetical protein